MKQETGKKQNKWLLPVIIAALLLIIGIVVAVFVLGGSGNEGEQPAGPVASGEIYWNINRADHIDPETGLSVRAAGEDGLYHINFAYNGAVVELTVNDKKLVNRIDMMDHMALEVDANGNITNVFATAEVANVAAENFFVQKMEGGVLMLNSSQALNGMEVPYQITEKTGIYNVSALAETIGGVDEVEPMDKVVVIQTKDGAETTHVFIVERMIASEVYWRVDQYYNSTKKITTRVPDAAGVYTIRFAVNGEQVDLKCKDVEVVSHIDSLANNVQCTGLTFDEQGFITGTIDPANAVRGALVSNQFDVTELTETGFSTVRMLPSSNQGSTWSGEYAEGCKFYDVTGVSGFIGIEVEKLELNDRVYVLTDAMGDAKIVFITNRMVEGDLYWLVGSRMYNSTTRLTTQKPDENGWYVMKFIKNGKIVELKTKDEAIASQVHAQSPQLMGLAVDGNVITKVYHYVNITGGWVATSGAAVSSMNGPIVTTVDSGNSTSLVLNGDCKVTNAFEYVEKGFGAYTDLRIGDQIYAVRNAGGEIIAIYITGRPVKGTKVYWNVSRLYANNASTRKPMPETHEFAGMYEFTVTTDGKRPEKLYAKTKTIADHIDRQYPQSVGLQVNGKVITAAVPSACVTGGYTMANYCHAEYWISEGYEFYALYRATGNGTKVKYNRETKIYNVSAGATSHIGQLEKDVKLNDQIHVITDTSGTAKYIYIVGQTVDGEPYYNLGQTVDENGNYTFKMLHKGKIVDLKAKDADVAAEVRGYTIGLGLHVKNGVITRAFSIASLAKYGGATAANFDVMKINGNKLTMQRTRPSSSNQGQEQIVELASGVKLYDVSAGTTTLGAVVKPKIGDRIVFYLNEEGTAPAIGFVTIRCNREGGAFGKCDHCGKTVYWNPWEGQFPANANLEKDLDSTHYYMNYDITLAQQQFVGNESQTLMASVLDLNGKTLSSAKRTLGAWYGATLYVIDSSAAQTGTVIGKGDPSNKDSGGVAFTTRGGSIVVNGGTWKVAEDHYTIVDGGIFNGFSHKDFKAGTITINGGKFYGTDVTGNGGTVSSNAPAIIINGGEFFGGKAGNLAGTIACPSNKLTINGGIIHGGEAKYGGTIGCPTIEINGGVIEAGKASVGGDCMYVSSTYKLNITGGKVGQITTTATWTGTMNISGAPEIGELIIADGKKVNMTGVTGGSINVTAGGAFTTEFKNDKAAQAVAKYLTSTNDMAQIVVKDKMIWCKIEKCLFGHTAAEHKKTAKDCVRPEILEWKLWSSTTTLPNATGNYILTGKVTTSSQTSLSGTDVVIDLNGYDIEYKIPEPRTADFRVFYLNDTANGNAKYDGVEQGKEVVKVKGSSLIITDNSTDDVTKQGTIFATNPAYKFNSNDETKWIATGENNATLALTQDEKVIEAAAVAAVEAELKKAAEADKAVKPEAHKKAMTKALKKGEQGSSEYAAEYNAVYKEEFAKLYKEKYDELYEENFKTKKSDKKKALKATADGNVKALTDEAEKYVATKQSQLVAGSAEYKAAVEAKYQELYTKKFNKIVEDYVKQTKADNEKKHKAANNGMIAQIANGKLEIWGGNLDASGLTIENYVTNPSDAEKDWKWTALGQAIYINGTNDKMEDGMQTLTVHGGTISGGKVDANGGTIYLASGAKLNMLGGIVNGAELTRNYLHGAAVFADGKAVVEMTGGVVNGGTGRTGGNSGAIYAGSDDATVTIAGNAVINPGKIENGDSLYMRFGTWTVGGNAVINGGVGFSDGGGKANTNLTIKDAPTIQMVKGGKTDYSFYYFNSVKKATFKDLKPGAKIAFNTAGAVSNQGNAAQLQAWIDAGYFVNETGSGEFVVDENVIKIGEVYCIYGHKSHKNVDCDEEFLLWSEWTEKTKLPTTSGNYFVKEGSTIDLTGQCIIDKEGTYHNVNLDLRGSTVNVKGNNIRALLIKATADSQYVITSTTKSKAVIKSTTDAMSIGVPADQISNGFLYANIGLIRLNNIKVDTSSIKTSAAYSSVAHVRSTGGLFAENCELVSGATTSNRASINSNGMLVLNNTTLNGGLHIEGSVDKVQLYGDVKLLPGTNCSYGVKCAAADAVVNCADLTAGSELVAANGVYEFADAAKAAEALQNEVIKPAAGMELAENGNQLLLQKLTKKYCINGHAPDATDPTKCNDATCTENTILTWTELDPTITRLPTDTGNYYFPEGSVVELSGQTDVVTENVTIRIDLNGSTVKQTSANRMMLIHKTGVNVTILDTKGGAKLQHASTAMTDSGSLFLVYTGTLNIRNGIEIDASAITSGGAYGGAIWVNTAGTLNVMGSTIKGGATSNGDAIYIKTTSGAVTLTDVTVEGNGIDVRVGTVVLKGAVDLQGQTNGFGIKCAAGIVIDCTTLDLANSKLLAESGAFKFVDATAATNALTNKVVENTNDRVEVVVDTADATKLVAQERVIKHSYCVNGHAPDATDATKCNDATCTENTIIEWTEWNPEFKNKKLPTTAGNYCLPVNPDGTGITVELVGQNDIRSGNVRIDLRGATVKQAGNNRMLMVYGSGINVTLLDSVGGAQLVHTAATVGDQGEMDGCLLYAHTGTLNILDSIKVDASSVTTTGNGGAIYVLTNGVLNVEGSEIIGGSAAEGNGIYNAGTMTLTDVTVKYGVYVADGAKTTLKGLVKLEAEPDVTDSYGIKFAVSSSANKVDCTDMIVGANAGEGSQIHAANGFFAFKDQATARNAMRKGCLTALGGTRIGSEGTTVLKVY